MTIGPNPLSLAAWSLHRTFETKDIDQLGMVQLAGKLGFTGFEMVNTFFPAPTYSYLRELRSVADDSGVELVLVMCDEEGDLAADDRAERLQAVRNHRRWVDVAVTLCCRAIRVDVGVEHEAEQPTLDHAAEALSALLEYAAREVQVLIENHGGLSSNAAWIVALIEGIGDPNLGTLPDFGNFGPYDRYEGVETLIPFAGGLSAKCYDFDERGEETRIDFARMVDIARAAGYRGFIGVEYEGERLPEVEGILAGKHLLERIQASAGSDA
jgi:sugar phosphate isomerase/epimerase